MELLSQDILTCNNNSLIWPLTTKIDFVQNVQQLAANNSNSTKINNNEKYYQEHSSISKIEFLNSIVKRSAHKKHHSSGPKMPVVFMSQKSKVECERSSRMSSWGFMSFVLSIVNGVINISNNINNNNNNRNNNNNDNNNNQFNTNLDSSSNTQMAGGKSNFKYIGLLYQKITGFGGLICALS